MAQPVIYRTPLAGRPPYATDEPDSVYQRQPSPTRRMRQPPPPNPNERTSAYNMYDQYLDGSGAPRAENPFDDSKQIKPHPIPLAAPQPGYASPVAALNLSRPSRAATPEGRQLSPAMPLSPEMSQAYPKPLTLVTRQASPNSANFPHTPHQLQPPMTPIAPAFIRPSSAASSSRDVKFSPTQPIMRGEKEETLLLKRGQGEDFWRRFSMVARDDIRTPTKNKQSTWLKKTMNGTNRHSRLVWISGMFLLIIIIAAIAFGVYRAQHSASSNTSSAVTAIGGSADEMGSGTSSSALAAGAGGMASSTYLHVSPTNTVARRDGVLDGVIPTSGPVAIVPAVQVLPESGDDAYAAQALPRSHARHRRSHVNRTLE